MVVIEYFIELKSLWEDLENSRPHSDCVSPMKCTCVVTENTKVDQDYALLFPTSLNDSF